MTFESEYFKLSGDDLLRAVNDNARALGAALDTTKENIQDFTVTCRKTRLSVVELDRRNQQRVVEAVKKSADLTKQEEALDERRAKRVREAKEFEASINEKLFPPSQKEQARAEIVENKRRRLAKEESEAEKAKNSVLATPVPEGRVLRSVKLPKVEEDGGNVDTEEEEGAVSSSGALKELKSPSPKEAKKVEKEASVPAVAVVAVPLPLPEVPSVEESSASTLQTPEQIIRAEQEANHRLFFESLGQQEKWKFFETFYAAVQKEVKADPVPVSEVKSAQD